MPRSPTEIEKERMRELRKKGYGLERIAKIVGFGTGTVYKYTKDIRILVGRYQKNLLTGIFDGTIIDIETTGLDPKYDDVITFGWLTKNEINVIQRAEASPMNFYEIIEEELTKIPRPLYAYVAELKRPSTQHENSQVSK